MMLSLVPQRLSFVCAAPPLAPGGRRCRRTFAVAVADVTRRRSANWVLLEIRGVLLPLLEVRIAAPVEVPCQHVAAVAHAEQKRALRSVGVFVQFARRMHHE